MHGADAERRIVARKVLREIIRVAGQNSLLRLAADADACLLVKTQRADRYRAGLIQPKVVLRVLRAVAGEVRCAAELQFARAVHAAAQDLPLRSLHFARQPVARDDAAVDHGLRVRCDDNARAVPALVVDDIDAGQIQLVIVAHADGSGRRAGDAAARERVFLVRRDIGLLPGKAPVVKDQLTGLADIVVARGPGPVAVRDGQHRGLRPFVADGKIDDAALCAVCEREGIAVQAERHLHAVFRHTQRLVQRPVLRQIVAAAFQLPAAHRQRLESRFLTGVLAVDCVDMRAVRRRFPCGRIRFCRRILLRLFGSFRVCFCRSRIGLCPVGGRSFRFCDRVRRLLRGLLCGLIIRRGRAHAAQPHDERQDQHQAEPSLFLHVLLLLWLEYYVYQKSTIFALYFQRFSPVLSKY